MFKAVEGAIGFLVELHGFAGFGQLVGGHLCQPRGAAAVASLYLCHLGIFASKTPSGKKGAPIDEFAGFFHGYLGCMHTRHSGAMRCVLQLQAVLAGLGYAEQIFLAAIVVAHLLLMLAPLGGKSGIA